MTASEDKYTRQTLLNVTPLTPSLFTPRTTRDPGFRFTAGQFARLGSPRLMAVSSGVRTQWRPRHMMNFWSSSPLSCRGEFTSELSRLREGDTLLIEKLATGYLTVDRFTDGRDLWLLSTGTGVAPFLSILQDFEVWEKFERIVLVYSAREEKELAYQPLIAGLTEREYLAEYADKLVYVPVVTREQVPGALNGRITQLIESGELEAAAGLPLTPEHSRVMICGNPQMIEDTRALLKARDMNLNLTRRPGQVVVENYW